MKLENLKKTVELKAELDDTNEKICDLERKDDEDYEYYYLYVVISNRRDVGIKISDLFNIAVTCLT
jgi:hypothetical protein